MTCPYCHHLQLSPACAEQAREAMSTHEELAPGQRVWMVIQGVEEDGPQLVEVMRFDLEWSLWEVRPVGDDGRVMKGHPFVASAEDVVPEPTR